MSKIPGDLKYTKSHEWLKLGSDGIVTVGITDHAQQALGDLVYVEPPKKGRKLAAGEACAVVESVKAASDPPTPPTWPPSWMPRPTRRPWPTRIIEKPRTPYI